jgi:hypothetical protein
MRDRWRVWCGTCKCDSNSLCAAPLWFANARADQNGLRADSAIRPGALLIYACAAAAHSHADRHHTQQFVCRERYCIERIRATNITPLARVCTTFVAINIR